MYDNELVAQKLRSWENDMTNFALPSWEEIPNIGLYMEQLLLLLKRCFDYLPPDVIKSLSISAPSINSYVRNGFAPSPVKKKYYRIHIANLIMIYTLKIGLGVSMLHRIMLPDMDEEGTRAAYTSFVERHNGTTKHFVGQVTYLAAGILGREDMLHPGTAASTEEIIVTSAVMSGMYRLLAEKLLLLQGLQPGDELIGETEE